MTWSQRAAQKSFPSASERPRTMICYRGSGRGSGRKEAPPTPVGRGSSSNARHPPLTPRRPGDSWWHLLSAACSPRPVLPPPPGGQEGCALSQRALAGPEPRVARAPHQNQPGWRSSWLLSRPSGLRAALSCAPSPARPEAASASRPRLLPSGAGEGHTEPRVPRALALTHLTGRLLSTDLSTASGAGFLLALWVGL